MRSRLVLLVVGLIALFAAGGRVHRCQHLAGELGRRGRLDDLGPQDHRYRLQPQRHQQLARRLITFTATADNGSIATTLPSIFGEFDAGAGFYTCTRSGGTAPAHNISCSTTVGT